jgi:thiol-disulfide isomerase/thioredoxin
VVIAAFSRSADAALQEAADGSVCFNNCSGHGDCRDYSCHCWLGYHGDDCRTTFANESNLLPIMSQGHYNLTKSNYSSAISKNKYILIGISSYSCLKCISVETEYEKISNSLRDLKIPFARASGDKLKSLVSDNEITSLPALVFYNKRKAVVYQGYHALEPVLEFIRKQTGEPTTHLKSVEAVNNFIELRNARKHSLSTVHVIGFFSTHEGMEEDDYDDYLQTAKALQKKEDIYFGVVTDAKVANHFKKAKMIDRTPSVFLVGENNLTNSINLDGEFFGESLNIRSWIQENSIPLVSEMGPANFKLFEQLNLPMLLLFLNLDDKDKSSQPGAVVGGRSGGLLNEVLLDEFREAARDHAGRIVFLYADAGLHKDQMRLLGLFGGKERVPSMAFNTKDGAQIPFSESLPVNSDTILQFCADYLSGKLKNAFDAQERANKALQATNRNTKNQAVRAEIKPAPETQVGVAEPFGDGAAGDSSITVVTLANFTEVVMGDDKDVLLLLHAKNCEACYHFAVYFKRMAKRFEALGIPSLTIARMDVTTETPPAELSMIPSMAALPLVLLLSADHKRPPWNFYTGVGKMQTMMKWVQEFASIPFELPNLPHLTEADRVLYKEQVREREEHLAAKRAEEEEAMRAEDLERERRRLLKEAAETNSILDSTSPDSVAYISSSEL